MVYQKLYINELILPVSIGVNQWEKTQRQKLSISLELEVDVTSAMKSDELNETVDYTTLVSRIETIVQHKHFQLVEHLCASILDALSSINYLKKASVKITKFAIAPNVASIQFSAEKSYS